MTRKLSDSHYVNNLKSDFITITHVYNNHFELFCGNVQVIFITTCFPSPLQVALLLYNPQTVHLLAPCSAVPLVALSIASTFLVDAFILTVAPGKEVLPPVDPYQDIYANS